MAGAGQQQPSTDAAMASAAIDHWVRRFEAAWHNGESPSLEAFLPADEPARQAALTELVHIDLERRLKRGEAARVEDYLGRFPELAADGAIVVELAAAEFDFRSRQEPLQPAEEFARRFSQFAAQWASRAEALFPPDGRADYDEQHYFSRGSGMAVALETFVKQLTDSGVVAPGKLENFIPPKAAPTDAEELARLLVESKCLTKFQAQEVFEGRAKSLILGNYTILDKIGSGGMGHVFKAQHRRMERVVALKMLPQHVMKDAASVARFEREVKAAARLEHPNIVTAYDADQAGEVHFLVMQYVDGQDLSELVKQSGPLPVAKAVNCILQAAKGLEFAHGEGVVHRDIKPANLLLDKKGIVKILDMGLARLDSGDMATQAELTGTGAVMGTVDYMAPEQALSSHHVDARADIYSLGCTLYYLLTGKPAYDGDTITAKLLAHQNQSIPDVRRARPEVSPQLAAVFRKMVAKRTEDRYQTMGDVIAALQDCAGAVAAPEKLSSAAPRATRSFGGNRRTLLAIGVCTLGGLIVLAAIILKLHTSDGTLVVKINQPDAMVEVLDEGGKVEIRQPGEQGTISLSVDPGRHQLRVEKGGFAFFTKEFAIQSGGQTTIEATLAPVENSAGVAGADSDKPRYSPAFKAWMKDVAALPAEKQVDGIAKKLVELNPGFDGKVRRKIEGGVVKEIWFGAATVTDISPVRALGGLNALNCQWGKLADLSPLRSMGLGYLRVDGTLISDLSPLKGMPLKQLSFDSCTKLWDLSPLAGMPLNYLDVGGTSVRDLSPLRGMKLDLLYCGANYVSDLSPLEGMQLTRLDFSPRMIKRGIDVVRQMTSLQSIGPGAKYSPAEFWKKYDAGEFGKPDSAITTLSDSGFQQWMKEVAALPAEQQVEAVAKKLQELNPRFDGKLTGWNGNGTPVIEDGVVTMLGISSNNIRDISPLRALVGLKILHCDDNWNLADLRPLKGLRLEQLGIADTGVSDLSPLAGMRLNFIGCDNTSQISDLSPLVGMPLKSLSCVNISTSDLSPLRGSSLGELRCGGTRVVDLSPLAGVSTLNKLDLSRTQVSDLLPLKGLPLTKLDISSSNVTDLSPLKGMPLTNLNCAHTQVSELSPLIGMKLTALSCDGTQVSDLRPLHGMPLAWLGCENTPVSDLSPLEGMTLENCSFTPRNISKGLDAIRQMKSLKTIGPVWDQQLPPAEFWTKYDRGEFANPAAAKP